MNITVNGSSINEIPSGVTNLEDVLVRLLRVCLPDNHLVGVVKINGTEFSELYPGQAKEVLIEKINELEITTVAMDKLASAGMKDGIIFLKRIVDSVRQTAELFRMSDDSEANEYFVKVLESIRALFQFIETTKNAIEWDFQTSIYNGHSVQAEWDKLQELITELSDTQQEGDWILLADLLEYEFAPALNCWKEIFSEKSESYTAGI